MAAMCFPAKKRLKKCYTGKYFTNEDCISELLVQVLSSLTLREAGRTSVLSNRWKYVWSYIPTLNFDSRDVIDVMEQRIEEMEFQWPKYLYWVDQVLSSHKAPIIDEFTLRFDFAVLNEGRNSISNWIRFASEKRVKKLVVDFSRIIRPVRSPHFILPCSSLSSACNRLTSLELVRINVTGEILESLLWKCLALEQLTVKHSESLVNLTVAGPLLKLKTLSIFGCFNVKKLEIYAPNLVYVCYFGPKINVHFKSTPKLAQVSIGNKYANDLIHSFSDLSSYLSQIEELSLSPYVRIERNVIGTKPGLDRGLRRPETGLHYYLNIVEIVGFVGDLVDIAIVDFLINITVFLDKIILHTCEKYPLRTARSQETLARMMAEAMRVRLERNTKLEIF